MTGDFMVNLSCFRIPLLYEINGFVFIKYQILH